MSRLIFLDTETSGLGNNSRMVEVAMVDVFEDLQTGYVFHSYLNPQRPVDAGAQAIHGLSNEFLETKPKFATIWPFMQSFLLMNDKNFTIVAHNAEFDSRMLNREIIMMGLPPIPDSKFFCTLKLARQKLPGIRHKLDSLCSHFGIKNDNRQLHGALLDANLLIQVYNELIKL